MGIVEQKHHLPRQSLSAGYGKLSNGKLFLIFISGSGKNPTNFSFVKIIHKFLQACPAFSDLPALCVLGMEWSRFIFQDWGWILRPVRKSGDGNKAEQSWDKVQTIPLCWLIPGMTLFTGDSLGKHQQQGSVLDCSVPLLGILVRNGGKFMGKRS